MSKNTGDGELDDILMSYTLSLVLDEEKAKTRGKSQEWENAQYNEHLKEAKTAIKKYTAQEANKAQRQPLKELLRELPKEVEAEEPNHNMPHSPEVAADQARNYTIQEITSLIQNKLEGLQNE